ERRPAGADGRVRGRPLGARRGRVRRPGAGDARLGLPRREGGPRVRRRRVGDRRVAAGGDRRGRRWAGRGGRAVRRLHGRAGGRRAQVARVLAAAARRGPHPHRGRRRARPRGRCRRRARAGRRGAARVSGQGAAGAVAPARTALVTGASRGIGRAIAVGLAAAGLDVALLARDADRLAGVAAEIAALGERDDAAGRAAVVTADVTDAGAVAAAVRAAEDALGGVDLLVNNAGRVDAEVPLWEADPDEWWAIVETNVRGPFLLARAVVPGMLARGGGRVVDLNSGAGSHDM